MTEVETFVRKFHQLWNDGVTAHLNLDTHGGQAWVGLRVHLGGHVPGPLHRPVHPFKQEVPRKESPSRQRRRERRAAARQARASDEEAVEACKNVQQTNEEQSVAVDAVDAEAVEDTAKEPNVDPVIDEFCSNAEYNENILSDKNSVSYRFILTEIKDLEVFKVKVRHSFSQAEVDISNQHFEISGCEILQDQLRFYLKTKNDEKATKAISNLKAEDILIRKIPKKKPNS